MDVLRFTYATRMRLVENQPGVPVRWLACAPGAKPLPFDHRMGSRIWEDDWRLKEDTGEFGEIYGTTPQWTTRSSPPACPDPRGPYWPEEYRPGVPSKDAGTFPALRMDAQGWPLACCGDPEFVDLFPACSEGQVMRLPGRFWLKFSPSSLGITCWVETTYVQVDRDSNGRWFGATPTGPHGLATEIIYDPASSDGPCRIRWRFFIVGIGWGEPFPLGLSDTPLPLAFSPVEASPNPPYVRWEWPSGFGMNQDLLCDNPAHVPPPWWRVELITAPPS
jgi:hypothetical protein